MTISYLQCLRPIVIELDHDYHLPHVYLDDLGPIKYLKHHVVLLLALNSLIVSRILLTPEYAM
jgi:hypothetical protein